MCYAGSGQGLLETTGVQAPPSSVLRIEIGQVPLELCSEDDELLRAARDRYAGFWECGSPIWPVTVRAAKKVQPGSESVQAEIVPSGPGFSFHLNGAWLRMGAAASEFNGVGSEYTLDSLLRVLLSMLLLPQRGFLLHAATVVRDGRAFIFTGRSGAGKSTIASLSPTGSVLTDEISLLRFLDGQWYAYGTPFWGEFRAEGMNRRVPVAGIYRLVQSADGRAEPVAAREAIRLLLPNVLFFARTRRERQQLLEIIAHVAETAPVYRLHFRPDVSFWEVIAG